MTIQVLLMGVITTCFLVSVWRRQALLYRLRKLVRVMSEKSDAGVLADDDYAQLMANPDFIEALRITGMSAEVIGGSFFGEITNEEFLAIQNSDEAVESRRKVAELKAIRAKK